MFIGRKNELNKLESMYASGKFEFPVVYGRRRVGKTTLIREFCKDKKTIYFAAAEVTYKENLRLFSRAVFGTLMPGVEPPVFSEIQSLLDYITTKLGEKLVLVIDEYPYLAQSERSISSILQHQIDHYWKDTSMMLILCGSSMSFMEYQVLGYKSPLYGRRTAQFKMRPFSFAESQNVIPSYSLEAKALLYGVTGGVPEYINRFDSNKDVYENIKELFFTPSGLLFEEPLNLLKQELNNFAVYNTVINAIARGASRVNEIATQVGVDTSACSQYLGSLTSLGIIKREVPYGEYQTSRKSIYTLGDQMFRFWYKFVSPNISAIEIGHGETLFDNFIKGRLSEHMGFVFEEMTLQFMFSEQMLKDAPFLYGTMGRWWGNNKLRKRQEEIDLISRHDGGIVLVECKWTSKKVDFSVLSNLIDKGRIFEEPKQWYFLVSKSGYTDEVIEYADKHDSVRLYELKDMENFECL